MIEQLTTPRPTFTGPSIQQLSLPAPLLLPRRPVKRILVPTDFSELSLEPLGLAAEIAKAAKAEIHFLYVDALGTAQPEHMAFPSADDVEKGWWRSGPHRLHGLAGANAFRPKVVRAVERGVEVAPTISRYAADHDIDLIVMATAARTGLARLFMGSVAEEVVRYAPCSVLIVHHDALSQPLSEPPRILSAIDFSETSIEAAKLAGELCRSIQAEHTVVHAVEQQQAPAFYGMEYALPPTFIDDLVTRSKKELRDLLKDGLEDADASVRVGSPIKEILKTIDEMSTDLVVVGSHGLSGLPRILLGSVAEKLTRLSPIPVLVVRPAMGDDEKGA